MIFKFFSINKKFRSFLSDYSFESRPYKTTSNYVFYDRLVFCYKPVLQSETLFDGFGFKYYQDCYKQVYFICA